MTRASLCKRHGPRRLLVFSSLVFGRDMFECDGCERDLAQRLLAEACRELLAHSPDPLAADTQTADAVPENNDREAPGV